MITKDDVLQSFDTRSSHLLDRVRDTAKRCIDLGVRVDIPGHNFTGVVAWDAYRDFCDACDAALFQLAELNPDAPE